ncbi:MAG TPA: FAD-dependent oxidoreductase [Pyrinomonadaceae bacterium]|nr:FAD-dependent oxidoreductase [Pyrinomonadaceae bacterium]
MAYEVVVVGGGIGGLTVAALVAARGVKVCVLEKESSAGGCAATFEKSGYTFERGAGLYSSWGRGEIHEKIFEELPVAPPETRIASTPYVVRLPDETDLAISQDDEEFYESLREAFPECVEESISFYREIEPLAAALVRANSSMPDLRTASKIRRAQVAISEARIAPKIYAAMSERAAQHLTKTSQRFRRFVDAQLQIFGQVSSEECAYLFAAVALMIPRRGMYSIRGGGQSLADSLVESIKRSGGTIRLNSPALRLSYDSSGAARGVCMLSGEIVEATRAVVSNLTVWDTYGKLVGLNRTPDEVRHRLKKLRGWGAYLIFAGMDEVAAARLPADHLLALTNWQEDQTFDAEASLFMFASSPAWDARAPTGMRAVTVNTFTRAEEWFSFHEDETECEEMDQGALERWWNRMHAMMPELGGDIEVIETMSPRDFYEDTRRKLGMVGGVGQAVENFGMNSISHRTHLPNLFMVGDTIFPGSGVAAVTQSALIVANEITK